MHNAVRYLCSSLSKAQLDKKVVNLPRGSNEWTRISKDSHSFGLPWNFVGFPRGQIVQSPALSFLDGREWCEGAGGTVIVFPRVDPDSSEGE